MVEVFDVHENATHSLPNADALDVLQTRYSTGLEPYYLLASSGELVTTLTEEESPYFLLPKAFFEPKRLGLDFFPQGERQFPPCNYYHELARLEDGHSLKAPYLELATLAQRARNLYADAKHVEDFLKFMKDVLIKRCDAGEAILNCVRIYFEQFKTARTAVKDQIKQLESKLSASDWHLCIDPRQQLRGAMEEPQIKRELDYQLQKLEKVTLVLSKLENEEFDQDYDDKLFDAEMNLPNSRDLIRNNLNKCERSFNIVFNELADTCLQCIQKYNRVTEQLNNLSRAEAQAELEEELKTQVAAFQGSLKTMETKLNNQKTTNISKCLTTDGQRSLIYLTFRTHDHPMLVHIPDFDQQLRGCLDTLAKIAKALKNYIPLSAFAEHLEAMQAEDQRRSRADAEMQIIIMKLQDLVVKDESKKQELRRQFSHVLSQADGGHLFGLDRDLETFRNIVEGAFKPSGSPPRRDMQDIRMLHEHYIHQLADKTVEATARHQKLSKRMAPLSAQVKACKDLIQQQLLEKAALKAKKRRLGTILKHLHDTEDSRTQEAVTQAQEAINMQVEKNKVFSRLYTASLSANQSR